MRGVALDGLLEQLMGTDRVTAEQHPARGLVQHQRMARRLRLSLPHQTFRVLWPPGGLSLRRRLDQLSNAAIVTRCDVHAASRCTGQTPAELIAVQDALSWR